MTDNSEELAREGITTPEQAMTVLRAMGKHLLDEGSPMRGYALLRVAEVLEPALRSVTPVPARPADDAASAAKPSGNTNG